jgi:exopolysaccharide production protein ExoY
VSAMEAAAAFELGPITQPDPTRPDGEAVAAARQPHLTVVTPSALRSRCVGWRWHVKRSFDIVVVLLAMPVALPLMGLLAVVTKLLSPGPVLFRQERVGHGGRIFPMLKIRTMYTDSTARLEADPELYERYVRNDFKLPGGEDPRLVPLGRFLRSTSLDELPQLFNVLRGDMSLVGPRPVVQDELRAYGTMVTAYVYVRPGITGRWQTEGRNEIRYPERALLDAEYVEHFRLRTDVAILCKTVPCVLRRNGVH